MESVWERELSPWGVERWYKVYKNWLSNAQAVLRVAQAPRKEMWSWGVLRNPL